VDEGGLAFMLKFVLHEVCKLRGFNSYVEVDRSSGVSNSYRA